MHRRFLALAFLLLFTPFTLLGRPSPARASLEPPCDKPGWFPDGIGLKDHHIFWYDGAYYLVSIYVQQNSRFAYARSTDLCTWEELPFLRLRSGEWADMAIWSPFVYEEAGRYYMYYTRVSRRFTQSIMLAVSDNPADPSSWEVQGVVFQPDHEGMVWKPGKWSDCRDPNVFRLEDTYYLYYTGTDSAGGILGIATADNPAGPWHDWGSVLPAIPSAAYESPALIRNGAYYYLFYNLTGSGEEYRTGATPAGPWSEARPFKPGWAHEFWLTPDGDLFTSYLTSYTVSISPLTWDDFYSPPRPWIGRAVYHLLLPYLQN